MNTFKQIEDFGGKYEINQEGIIRNVNSKRETKIHHISKKIGPVISLSHKGSSTRCSVVGLVISVFGSNTVPGWSEVTLAEDAGYILEKKTISPEEKAARALKKQQAKEAREKAKREKQEAKDRAFKEAQAAAIRIMEKN